MNERALTVRQPWADLIMAGVKDVENRTWPVPSTLPQWWRCPGCHLRVAPEHRRQPGMGGVGHFCAVLRGTRDTADVEYDDGPFPFRLWVHAGQEVAWRTGPDALNLMLYHAWEAWNGVKVSLGYGPRAVHPRNDMLMGHVTVTGCHHADDCRDERSGWGEDPLVVRFCSRWAGPGVHHWTLVDPVLLPEPIPMRGRLGLWRLPEGVPA